ncbi:MAG: type II secretion system protein [Desulfobacterales bacterium]|nr:type II secretion system protein [Desulfobacterales bacterium]
MNQKQKGFTLIELVVVMFLLSITLFFALPNINNSILSNSKNQFSRWLILNIKALKEKSTAEQNKYILHIAISTGRLWITNETMGEEDKINAARQAYKISNDIKIIDVELMRKGIISSGRVDINFYKGGYSDKAFIHFADEKYDQFTVSVEPFIGKVIFYDGYIQLKD